MDELLDYLKTVSLPTEPVKIKFMTVDHPSLFIESCQRMHERNDPLGVELLTQYRVAVDKLNEQAAPDQPDAPSH